MTGKELGDLLKNLTGIAGAALAWFEKQAELLPINQVIRVDLLNLSSVLAMVSGFAAHQYAKRTGSHRAGKAAGAVAILALVVIFAGSAEALNVLPPKLASIAVRSSYVAFFSAIGAIVGDAAS